jgi:hypothetical protein
MTAGSGLALGDEAPALELPDTAGLGWSRTP